jgi:hypothetical protein
MTKKHGNPPMRHVSFGTAYGVTAFGCAVVVDASLAHDPWIDGLPEKRARAASARSQVLQRKRPARRDRLFVCCGRAQ